MATGIARELSLDTHNRVVHIRPNRGTDSYVVLVLMTLVLSIK